MSAAKSISTRKVHISDLVLDERCQARERIDSDAVGEYSASYAAGVELPPPAVYSVSGKLYVVDGYHRVPAAIKAGLEFLRVVIVGEGTIDDAEWFATGVNKDHGVRRSNADKRRALRMALETEIGVEQSTQTLAKHVGVSVELATEVRRAWESARNQTPERRKDSAGRWQPARRDRSDTSKAKSSKSDTKRAEPPENIAPSIEPEKQEEPLPFEPLPETKSPMPQYGHALRRIAEDIRRARLDALRALPEEKVLLGLRQQLKRDLDSAEDAVRLAEPIACPKCTGGGCRSCGDHGWTTKLAAGVR